MSITQIVSNLPAAANHGWCMAHIINLVSKIILWQFDTKRKTKKKSVKVNDKPKNGTEETEQDDEDDITSLTEGLKREEQEVADDEDDKLNESIAVNLEEIEDVMKEEISVIKNSV